MLAAAAVRLFRLGSPSLWIDEVFTLNSSGIGAPLPWTDLLDNVHGPLYSLGLHLWSRVAGQSEWALRLPSALFGIALVPAMALLAERWIGREAAKPAAWLAAFSPFLVWYSQELRNYALLMLCAALASAALLGLVRAPSAARATSYLAAAWAGLMSNLSFALLGPLHLKWWLEAGARRRAAGLAIAAGLLGVLLLPWMLQAMRIWDFHRLHPGQPSAGAEPLRGATTFHAAAVPFALHAFAVGYTLGPTLRELRTGDPEQAIGRHWGEIVAVTLVFGGLGVFGLASLQRRGRLLDVLVWFAVPVALLSYFALRNFKVFHPRYLAVCMPAFLLVMAAALADLPRLRRIGFALALAVLWGASLLHLYFDPRYGKEDYRGTAALVRERGQAGEKLLALGAQEPVFYYYRGPLPADRMWLGFAADPARLETKLAAALAGARGAWLVLSRSEDLDPRDAFAAYMGRRFPDAERFGLAGVRVWHLDRGAVARLEGAAAD